MRPGSRLANADNPLYALRKRSCRSCDRAHARPFAANDTEMRQPVSQRLGSSYRFSAINPKGIVTLAVRNRAGLPRITSRPRAGRGRHHLAERNRAGLPRITVAPTQTETAVPRTPGSARSSAKMTSQPRPRRLPAPPRVPAATSSAVRAPALHAGRRGFESFLAHYKLFN